MKMQPIKVLEEKMEEFFNTIFEWGRNTKAEAMEGWLNSSA